MVQQSKIFFTALFGRLFLGRILSQVRGMRTAQHGMCFARCILCMHTMRAPCMHVLPHGTPSQPKWCALVCLVLGVLLITLEAMPSAQACDRQTDTRADGRMDGWVGGWIDGWMARQVSLSFSIHLRPGLRRPQRGAQRGHGRQPALVRGGRRGGGARLASVGLRDRLL